MLQPVEKANSCLEAMNSRRDATSRENRESSFFFDVSSCVPIIDVYFRRPILYYPRIRANERRILVGGELKVGLDCIVNCLVSTEQDSKSNEQIDPSTGGCRGDNKLDRMFLQDLSPP
jgi:hypothetical protein